jgi:hypothetical protein
MNLRLSELELVHLTLHEMQMQQRRRLYLQQQPTQKHRP